MVSHIEVLEPDTPALSQSPCPGFGRRSMTRATLPRDWSVEIASDADHLSDLTSFAVKGLA